MVLNLSRGIVVLWKLLLEVNVSIALNLVLLYPGNYFKSNISMVLNLSCGIVVLWKLLLEVNVSIALNLVLLYPGN